MKKTYGSSLIYVFTQPLNSYYQASLAHFLVFFGFHLVPIIYIFMLFQVVKEEVVESCILDEETMVEMTLSSSLPSISTIQQVSRQVFAFITVLQSKNPIVLS
jgi:hypothetical protein